MAIVIKRGKKLHIQWWDPVRRKTISKTTGLNSNYESMKLAKQIAKEIQQQINEEYDKVKNRNFRELTIQDAFDKFLEANCDKAAKTIRDYERFYTYFTKRFTQENGHSETIRYFSPDDPISKVNKANYEDWLVSIKKLNQKQNSIHAIGKQGNNFINFLFEKDFIGSFVVYKRYKTKPVVPKKKTFYESDLIKIFDNLKNKNDNFKLLIYLLYYTGLRSKDLLTIRKNDIDLNNRLINYTDNKRKIDRTVPYHNKLHSIFSKMDFSNGEEKILNYSNEDNVTKAVKRYFEVIGLNDRPLFPRIFRKTFITTLRSLGVDETLVQDLVGHAHTTVMDIHYNDVHKKLLKNALRKYPSFEMLKKRNKQKKS